MTPEEIRDEAIEDLRRDWIPVRFEVECDEFRVPKWPGLVVSATYQAIGEVKPDRSGDGVPEVDVFLGDPTAYSVCATSEDGYDCPLPKWLEEQLAKADSVEMDEAFLEAIGGQNKLDELAIEKALA